MAFVLFSLTPESCSACAVEIGELVYAADTVGTGTRPALVPVPLAEGARVTVLAVIVVAEGTEKQ